MPINILLYTRQAPTTKIILAQNVSSCKNPCLDFIFFRYFPKNSTNEYDHLVMLCIRQYANGCTWMVFTMTW